MPTLRRQAHCQVAPKSPPPKAKTCQRALRPPCPHERKDNAQLLTIAHTP